MRCGRTRRALAVVRWARATTPAARAPPGQQGQAGPSISPHAGTATRAGWQGGCSRVDAGVNAGMVEQEMTHLFAEMPRSSCLEISLWLVMKFGLVVGPQLGRRSGKP